MAEAVDGGESPENLYGLELIRILTQDQSAYRTFALRITRNALNWDGGINARHSQFPMRQEAWRGVGM
jgi:hypothetical protein